MFSERLGMQGFFSTNRICVYGTYPYKGIINLGLKRSYECFLYNAKILLGMSQFLHFYYSFFNYWK